MSQALVVSKNGELTERDKSFLDALCDPDSPNYGNVSGSLRVAGFHEGSRTHILRRLSNEIAERAKGIYASNAITAVKNNVGILDGTTHLEDEFDIKKARLKVEIAQDLMDRVGISKKQQVEVEHTTQAIVFLPSKQRITSKELPIDAEFEEVEA